MLAARLALTALAVFALGACSGGAVEKAASAISDSQRHDVAGQAAGGDGVPTLGKSEGEPLVEGFPATEVPLVDAVIVASNADSATQWNVLMQAGGQAQDFMQVAATRLGEAGFTADGIQAETMSQWSNEDFAVTLVITPLAGDESQVAINYAVTAL